MCVLFEFVDHGGRRGDTAQALARWRHPLASSEALGCIAMAIEIVVDLPAFLLSPISLLATTIS